MRYGLSKGLVTGSLIGIAAATAAIMSMPESAALRRSMKRKATRVMGQAMMWRP